MGNTTFSDGNRCPICGRSNCFVNATSIDAPFYYYECENCGEFFAPNTTLLADESDDVCNTLDLQHLQSYLFYHKSHLRPVICTKEYFDKHITGEFVKIYNITPEMVEGWYPKTFAEKIDLILLKLGSDIRFDGDDLWLYDMDKRMFFTASIGDNDVEKAGNIEGQRDYIIEYLISQKYVQESFRGMHQLSPKALEYICNLQRQQANNKKVFVAMKFGEETKELREKIKEGLKEYDVRIMDEIEHNHQIVPEMLYEIRNSRFVVAELSHHNNGAYYEAGYALGLGKEVIHICDRKELKSGLHFDVAQVNTICYDSIDEIPEKLRKRIEATIK